MRHVRKQQKSLMPKILLIVVLVAALSISFPLLRLWQIPPISPYMTAPKHTDSV